MTFELAKEQILRNDLAKAAQLRDEYKMQLDAANKELAVLKERNQELLKLYNGMVTRGNEYLITKLQEAEKENKAFRELIEKEREEAFQEFKQLKKQLANAEETIVNLRKLREEEKDKIDQEKLYKLYMDKVELICETYDWVTNFGPKEIVQMISLVIEQNPDIIKTQDEN